MNHAAGPRLGVALIGTQHHGKTLYDVLAASNTFEVISAFDTNVEALKAFHERGVVAAESFDEALACKGVDAVIIAAPNPVHHEQTRAALNAGKHVFVEKPLAVTLNQAADIARRAGRRIVQVGHNTRAHRHMLTCVEAIKKGMIGSIVGLEGNYSHPAGLGNGVPQWKLDENLCPLLPMTQTGVHVVDMMQMLAGNVEEVCCMAHSAMMRNGDVPVIDSSVAALRFTGGVLGTLQSHYITPFTLFVRVYGTAGMLSSDNRKTEFTDLQGHTQTLAEAENAFGESIHSELEAFYQSIVNGAPNIAPPEIGLRNMAVIEAMRRSVKSNSVVAIADVLGPYNELLSLHSAKADT